MKFILVESIKELNEIYPNKGESKKDFVARFMSVTKDEYPDVKQRYAVANSYWSRRNKKRTNEAITYIDPNRSTATTKDGTEFNIWTEYTGGYKDQEDYMKIAYVGDNWIDENDKIIKKNLLGYLEYSVYDGEAYIQMIEVRQSEKRKGIATALIQSLQHDYKDINWGYTTEEGTRLKRYIDTL